MFQAPYVGAVVMPGGACQPRRSSTRWQEWAKQRGAKGLAYVLVGEDGTLGGPVAKNLSDAERDGLAAHVGAQPGDCVFFSAGPGEGAAGAARRGPHRDRPATGPDRPEGVGVHLGGGPAAVRARRRGDRRRRRRGRVRRVDGGAPRVHRAEAGVEDTFDTDPGSALADAYDIVCNGNEIGGGIDPYPPPRHPGAGVRGDGHSHKEAQEKFGFLLDAFTFGAPPHGGIAFGWDRITALLAGMDSIREVIAFPKSGGGVDPLTDAPAPITPQQRKESGIDAKPDAR